MFPGVLNLTAKTEILVVSTINAKNMPGWERNAKKNPASSFHMLLTHYFLEGWLMCWQN